MTISSLDNPEVARREAIARAKKLPPMQRAMLRAGSLARNREARKTLVVVLLACLLSMFLFAALDTIQRMVMDFLPGYGR